ncbi:MAG: biopolymer transporter ExbD [Opitutaceae bacterium]|jgi:biopolymer transport protein ExbD
MISRPLDLSSKLRPPSRDWDWLFFVNVGLIVLFFMLFGSRFVLAPGLGTDFRMPVMPAARAGASITTPTAVISIKRGNLIFTDSGNLSMPQLKEWLKAAARSSKEPILLVRASSEVAFEDLTEITTAARDSGFVRIVWGAEAPSEMSAPATP